MLSIMNRWLFACICLAIIKSSQHDKNENLFQLPPNVYQKYYKLRINTLLQEDKFEHNSEVEIRYKEFAKEKAKDFRMASLTVEQVVEKLIIWQNWQEFIYPKISHALEKIIVKDEIEKGGKNDGKEDDSGSKNDEKGVYYASKNGGGAGGLDAGAPRPVESGDNKKMKELLKMLIEKDNINASSTDERELIKLLKKLIQNGGEGGDAEGTKEEKEGDGGGEDGGKGADSGGGGKGWGGAPGGRGV